MSLDPFRSPAALSAAFEQGLAAMLERPGLGTFILAAANASFEPGLWERLRPALAARFDSLAEGYRQLLQSGQPLPDAADDVSVFLKLAHIGFAAVAPTRFRQAGPWELQFNLLRSFRPQRGSHGAVNGTSAPFDPNGFHFNKPFLAPEILWQGELVGRDAAFLYNKFPFVERHGILVPERRAERPQLLDAAMLHWAWAVTESLAARLPGFGLGYNAYGAHASINHLHLQTFVRQRPLPLEGGTWRHNGGPDDYPAAVQVFDRPDPAWAAIAELHDSGVPYNAVFRPGRVYLLSRRPQGSFSLPDWCGQLSWYELAGGAITFDLAQFDSLTASDFSSLLAGAGRR